MGRQWGLLRGQHDVYNAGMLIEAGVHYYQATGKTRLLEIATRFANYMADYMGPEPRMNIVPAHSGPEEAVMALYWLYKNEPELKDKLSIPVRESDYYNLATFDRKQRASLWLSIMGNVGIPEIGKMD